MMDPQKNDFPYEDMLQLPRPVSRKHRPMAREDRAAQFAPFAALTGFGAVISETARLTDAKIHLDGDQKAELDRRLSALLSLGAEGPVCEITYFTPDRSKAGGSYKSLVGRVRSLDSHRRRLIMADQSDVILDDIISIEAQIFNLAEE